MSKLQVEQVLVLNDNYVYLLHDPTTGATAAVDPAVAAPVQERLAALGWSLTDILVTHHHADHTDGIPALKAASGCRVVGAASDRGRIPGLDLGVGEGDLVAIGSLEARVLTVPGHTSGHLAYWFEGDHALFCGDTLFALGCGRLFEGSAEQMWESLGKLRDLPDETLVYCAHEYTQSNARFARTVEGANPALLARIAQVEALRAENRPTVPSTMGAERATNPFLRADQDSVKQAIGLPGAEPARVFAEIRRRKDKF